jgi:16S rRNA (uracil1498-N3)-methyltransferase
MDWIIEKAVELGVARIEPLAARRSVVRLSGERAERREAHWRRVAIAACEQCGRNRIPEVHALLPVDEYRATEGTKILLSPLAELPLSKASLIGNDFILAAGPEAGFTAQEEAAFAAAGFVPASLGPRVLRTETAAVAALAALSALRGDS